MKCSLDHPWVLRSPQRPSSTSSPGRSRFNSASAGKPTIVPVDSPKTRKPSLSKLDVTGAKSFAVVAGVKRGHCQTASCACAAFSKKESGLSCKTCSHFAGAHADLGRDDGMLSWKNFVHKPNHSTETQPQKMPSSPRRSEVRVLDRVLSMSSSDYTLQTKTQLREQLVRYLYLPTPRS